MKKSTKKPAKRSLTRTKKRSTRNAKHPTATYPRASLKLPKGVEPKRKRAASKKNPITAVVPSGSFKGWNSWGWEGSRFYERTINGHFVRLSYNPNASPPCYYLQIDGKTVPKAGASYDTPKAVLAAVKKSVGSLQHNPSTVHAAKEARKVRRLKVAQAAKKTGRVAKLRGLSAVDVERIAERATRKLLRAKNLWAKRGGKRNAEAQPVPAQPAQTAQPAQPAQTTLPLPPAAPATPARANASKRRKGKKNMTEAQRARARLHQSTVRQSARAALTAEKAERKLAKARASLGKKNAGTSREEAALFHFELAALYDQAVQLLGPQPNWLGFLRRVPDQQYYREPPRRAGMSQLRDVPTDRELDAFRGELILAIARAKRNAGKSCTKNATTATKPKRVPAKKDFARVVRIFKKYVAIFAKRYPNVAFVGLKVDPSIHDSARHFAMTGVPSGSNIPVVRIAPELAFEPVTVQTGIIIHELAHAVRALKYLPSPKDYDVNERATDKLAEKVAGLKIYYDSRGVEVAGKGAKGKRPRPDGLR